MTRPKGVKRMRVRRRALSPLVSSVVLISAAIIGGVIVYNYFQSNINSIAAATGSIQISADYTYLNSTTKVVYLEVLNTYKKPITISSIKVVLDNGTTITIDIQDQIVDSGSKGSLIVNVPASGKLVYLVYQLGEKTMYSSPIQIS